MNKYRLKFTKTDKMRFIGHLDLLTYFQRAIKRAKLPISYSQGFNPHQLMSFAIPLPLGMSSVGEYIDIQLDVKTDTDEIMDSLNQQMSNGIEIIAVRLLKDGENSGAALVTAADYNIILDRKIEDFSQKYDEICKNEQWLIEKVGKRKKVKEVDIKPDVFCFKINEDDGKTVIKTRIATGSQQNLKVDLLLEYIYRQLGLELEYHKIKVTRMEMYYKTEGGAFLPL